MEWLCGKKLLAVRRSANVPRLVYPRVRVFRMSDAVFAKGVVSQVICRVAKVVRPYLEALQ